jgi:hypothetical protein
VRVDGAISEEFALNNGLKQGSVLSPILFNVFFGAIIDAFEKEVQGKGVDVRYKINSDIFDVKTLDGKKYVKNINLLDFLFADDTELIATSVEKLQYQVDVLDRITRAFGQEISIKKTEVMVTKVASDFQNDNRNIEMKHNVERVDCAITIQGKQLTNLDNFKYLGNTQNTYCTMKNEIQIRISRMTAAYTQRAERILENPKIAYRVKVKQYKTFVLMSGLYSCGCWTTKNQDLHKLDSWQYRTLRKMLGYKWQDFKSYSTLLKQINKFGSEKIYPIELEIRLRRLRYLGHVQRMKDGRLPKIMLHGDIKHGKRLCGGQRKTFRACIRDDLRCFGIHESMWMALAEDRNAWRLYLDEGFQKALQDWYDIRDMKHNHRQAKLKAQSDACHVLDSGRSRRQADKFIAERKLVEEAAEKELFRNSKNVTDRKSKKRSRNKDGNAEVIVMDGQSRTRRLIEMKKAEDRRAAIADRREAETTLRFDGRNVRSRTEVTNHEPHSASIINQQLRSLVGDRLWRPWWW